MEMLMKAAAGSTFVCALALLLVSCASWQVRRAREARAALGDFLYTESRGAGTRTIVLLPGILGTTHYWQAARFDERRIGARLLYIDPLGFGRSPWPDIDYTIEDHVLALHKTLVHERATGRLTIVAHSFGAVLAAEYGARYPEEIDHLLLVGTPVFRNEEEGRHQIAALSQLASFVAHDRLTARIVCAFHNAFPSLAAHISRFLRPDLPADVASDATLHYWRSLNGTVRNVLFLTRVEASFSKLPHRITFVHGRRDRVTPVSRIEEVARANADDLIVTDDNHSSYWKNAASVLTARLEQPASEGSHDRSPR